MSVIGKKPFINTIIDECNKTQVESIVALLNNLGTPSLVALYGDDNLISSANIGVNYVTLKMNEVLALIPTGILVYLDNSHCGFFVVNTNSDNITEYVIDPVARTYLIVNEYLTVEELRQVCGDRLVEVGGGVTVQADDIDSGSATEGQTLVANGQGGAVWADAGGGLPEADGPNKVIVSNENNEGEWKDSVPKADNLLANPETNDALYSNGPTGGLADIVTGEEAYLQEVKGYSIVWNQLSNGNDTIYLKQGHMYIYWDKNSYNGSIYFSAPAGNNDYLSSNYKVCDLTLMFGGNDKIPFNIGTTTEYPANGNIPAQTYSPGFGFARLFPDLDFANVPYDAGTIKNVAATKLVETGQNLWDASTMETTGCRLLAGYNYEIYGTIGGSSYRKYSVSYDNGNSWMTVSPTAAAMVSRADGKYVWRFKFDRNVLVKSHSDNPLAFIGFIHSGNYCLTTGTLTNSNSFRTDATVPIYKKYEFNVNVSGLNGIPDNSDNKCSIYDTKDYKRVEKITDLSTLEWTDENSDGIWTITVNDIKPSTTQLLATKYFVGSFDSLAIGEMAVDENKVLKIRTENHSTLPSGTLLYELAEPVATGQPAFEPIPLKDSQGNWIVNDMGSEYFIQPAGTNCPVNQMSYYYANLKDKLVNLEIPEISQTSWAYNKPSLEAININGTIYKVAPLGSFNNMYSLAIGAGSNTRNNGTAIGRDAYAGDYGVAIGYSSGNMSAASYSIAIGYNSYGTGQYSVSIGYGHRNSGTNSIGIGREVWATGNYAIAIGSYVRNGVPYSITFDTTSSGGTNTTYHLYSPEYIFFRNEQNTGNNTSLSQYTQVHFLNEYIKNNLLTNDGTDLTKYYLSYTDANNYKTITGNCVSGTFTAIDKLINAVHITLKISGTTSHSVVGLDLLPYDATNSYGFTSYGRVIVDGTVEDITATIDSDGIIVITAPTGATIDEARYNIK